MSPGKKIENTNYKFKCIYMKKINKLIIFFDNNDN